MSMSPIPLLASVALLVDIPEHGLTRGQIGTVVEHLAAGDDHALLVEFTDATGQTCAMAALKPEQLMVLHRQFRAA